MSAASAPNRTGAARSTRSARARRELERRCGRERAATTSPTGGASSKPAFFPSSTPGVASACRPRNAALARKASETRKRRASRRRRAGDQDGVSEPDTRERSGQNEPEVRRVALPALVDRRLRQHDHPQDRRDDGRSDPELHAAVISLAIRGGGCGTGRCIRHSRKTCGVWTLLPRLLLACQPRSCPRAPTRRRRRLPACARPASGGSCRPPG